MNAYDTVDGLLTKQGLRELYQKINARGMEDLLQLLKDDLTDLGVSMSKPHEEFGIVSIQVDNLEVTTKLLVLRGSLF